jgi:hypothetical protein
MTSRIRFVLATAATLIGSLVLGIWIYTTTVLRAYDHMFKALGFQPEVSHNWGYYLLRCVGGGLIGLALVLLLFPVVRRAMPKDRA